MKFKLTQKVANQTRTMFQILNERGDIVGSVSVSPNEANDLLACWKGGREEPRAPAVKAPTAKKMTAAKTKAAVLRGC